MIVRDQPSALQLFFTMKGSIVPRIMPRILGVAGFAIFVTLFNAWVMPLPQIPIAAMGIFGVALSLFLGFRNNAAYDRWWEARKLWGAMIADTRTLARDVTIFVPDPQDRRQILRWAVGFAHLHRGFLRGVDAIPDLIDRLDPAELDLIRNKQNRADAALHQMTDHIAFLSRDDQLTGFGQMTLAGTLSKLANAQAGCERIATTPLPFVYSLLVRRTTYIYCWLLPFALLDVANIFTPIFAAVVAYVFFGLQAVTNELEMPFHNVENGLPLDAMCRTIEISVSEALGDPPLDPKRPENYILT